jgi:protein CpxP
MNKTIFQKTMMRTAMVAVCATVLGTMPMLAQDNGAAPATPEGQAGPPQAGMRGGQGREERQLQMMTKKLNLTPDQVTQVKAINEDSRTQAMAVRSDGSIAAPDKKAKMMDIHKAAQDKIRAVLTDDQKTKYDAMQAQMRERRESHEGGQNAAPPPPPQ